ncbi:GMC oxidoreductase, partial [Sphaerobolus stellatus SS14]
SDSSVLAASVPFLAPTSQPVSPILWNYTTVPQKGLDNRILGYSRGRILGGSSSVNFMTYTRGSDDDYNRWASLTGDSVWSWKNLQPYYLKSSRLVAPADNHNTNGQVNPAVHGNGPVQVSVPGFPTDIDARVINSSRELASQFPFNIDVQSGNTVGISECVAQNTVDSNGRRSSSSTAYLQPILSRPNLDVLMQTQVTQLKQSGVSARKPVFNIVEFAQSRIGPRSQVTARNEVILCAGAINTPQILMLSGIGDSTTLRKLGITPILNLSDVGQNLQDHPILSNYFVVNTTNTFDTVLRDVGEINTLLTQWNNTGKGLFVDAPGNTLGFFRVNQTVLRGAADPSAG